MNAKLVTPNLGSLDDEPTEMPAPTPPPRPELRVPPRRSEPRVDSLVRPGFVTDAVPVPEPTEPTEVLTIEVPSSLSELRTSHEQIGHSLRECATRRRIRIHMCPLTTYSSAKLLTPTGS
jgi:hypothetical protein